MWETIHRITQPTLEPFIFQLNYRFWTLEVQYPPNTLSMGVWNPCAPGDVWGFTRSLTLGVTGCLGELKVLQAKRRWND